MAKDKSSFILYSDTLHTVRILSDEQAGKLFKTILEYVNDEDPNPTDPFVVLAFEPIKQQLKRDLKNWEKIIHFKQESGRIGGLKSGESRRTKQNEANEAKRSKGKQTKQTQANEPVSVSVNDSVSVSERVRAFAPPTRDEVVSEMQKKLDDFTAEGEADKFLDFYSSKGWVVGRVKMKNWQASVRNWIRGINQFTKNQKDEKLGTSEARIKRAANW